jgi:DNA-binding transcriptional MerR regulator
MAAAQQVRELIDLGMTVEQAGEVLRLQQSPEQRQQENIRLQRENIRLQLIREVSPEQRQQENINIITQDPTLSPEQRMEMTRLLMSPNGREVVFLL